MDKLEFENFENERPSIASQEDKTDDSLSQADAIDLSNRIIVALRNKVIEFNKANPKKRVILSQLKEVYRRGATMRSSDPNSMSIAPDLGNAVWAMARVNMFLRMKYGDKVAMANKGKAAVRKGSYIDVSANWDPSEEDLLQAKKDMEEHRLFNFDDISELYLEEYQKIDIEY